MKKLAFALVVLVSGLPALASSLGTAARTVIPVEVQQIINVDYRRMKNSDTAMQMKAKLLPPNMKQFEDALKGIGVDPDRDLEQITLASFRTKDKGLGIIGVAQGQFPRKVLATRLAKQKIVGKTLNGSKVYPMSGGMQMVFLDDWTMLFGEATAVQAALDARDDSSKSLNANREITDMISSVDQATVWSVLDSTGTQTMLKSALGTAANLAEYDTVKKHLLGSRYTMDFDHGVDFNLNIVTSDNMTAATLSSVLKAGILLKKMDASPVEKVAIDGTTVDSDAGKLVVHFKADDKSFQSLLDAPMFAAVTH
ncbi:MAG TPA: hypothetical protein VKL40_12000 [Candidatus Angelobacter sp.]|nr:hypothetical protein [Candidatus Angelobacter sp.]